MSTVWVLKMTNSTRITVTKTSSDAANVSPAPRARWGVAGPPRVGEGALLSGPRREVGAEGTLSGVGLPDALDTGGGSDELEGRPAAVVTWDRVPPTRRGVGA
jgi:hypothetical protein